MRRPEQGQAGYQAGCIAILPASSAASRSLKQPQAELRPTERAVIIHRLGRAGCPMHISVPLDHYRGVSADIRYGQDGLHCDVVLAHGNSDYDVVLFSADDDENILAEWHAWAARLSLPLLIRSEHGDVLTRQRFGPLQVDGVSPRRARRLFLMRRPRFLRRRLTGSKPSVLRVHHEREIIARD